MGALGNSHVSGACPNVSIVAITTEERNICVYTKVVEAPVLHAGKCLLTVN